MSSFLCAGCEHFAVRSPKRDNLFSDVLLACALAETIELGHIGSGNRLVCKAFASVFADRNERFPA
jgi:hypothetical protein